MIEWFSTSLVGALLLCIGSYCLGCFIKKKTGKSWCNPLLIACICVLLFLIITGMSGEEFNEGTGLLTDLLTPALVCLAIPLYKQIQVLKENKFAILAGTLSGVLVSFITVTIIALLFHLSYTEYVTLMPKSVTTAIGMAVSEELGGIESITVAAILITGLWGSIIAPFICRIFHISNPIAKGVAIGSSCHVIGTSRAFEMGEVEGAMSSLSTVVSGLLTAVLLPIVVTFY